MIQYRLRSIFLITFIVAASCVCLLRFWPIAEVPETSPAGWSRAMPWPCVFVGKGTNDRLIVRHEQYCDSGVEVERVKNGRIRWTVYAEPLGVDHSQYSHSARVTVTGRHFEIYSRGSSGTFREIRLLRDGSLVSRRLE